MIRPHDDGPLVYLCVEPVDGRKQINGLAALVQDTLQMNPFSEQLLAAIAPAAAKTPARSLAQVLGPFTDRFVAARAAQHRGGGQRQHRGHGIAPALGATWVGNVSEKRRQGTHMLGTQHHLRCSMVVNRREYRCLRIPVKPCDEKSYKCCHTKEDSKI
jgi:hypothetical protein